MLISVYKLVYWLPKQSKCLSSPQVFETENRGEWQEAVNTAVRLGYEIEFAGQVARIADLPV